MSYTFLDGESLQMRETISFPTIGGLDLATDKLSTHPGSLQDCMNYEVGKEAGYRLAPGLLRWNGTVTYFLPRFIVGDYSTIVNGPNIDSFYHGGIYTASPDNDSVDSSQFSVKLKVLKIDTDNNKVYFQIVEGNWAIPLFVYENYSVTDNGSFVPYVTADGKYYKVKE